MRERENEVDSKLNPCEQVNWKGLIRSLIAIAS